MIKVYLKNLIFEDEILVSKRKGEISITIEGHSGFGEKGSDIVCSAISAVAQTCIVAIARVAKIHQKIEQRDGYLKSTISTKGVRSSRRIALRTILSTMMVGLREIMDNYPDSVEIIFE